MNQGPGIFPGFALLGTTIDSLHLGDGLIRLVNLDERIGLSRDDQSWTGEVGMIIATNRARAWCYGREIFSALRPQEIGEAGAIGKARGINTLVVHGMFFPQRSQHGVKKLEV